jgi:hypothetical protein
MGGFDHHVMPWEYVRGDDVWGCIIVLRYGPVALGGEREGAPHTATRPGLTSHAHKTQNMSTAEQGW